MKLEYNPDVIITMTPHEALVLHSILRDYTCLNEYMMDIKIKLQRLIDEKVKN